MELNEYQKKALSTKIYGSGMAIIYPALKLNGEAGEVAEKVGKTLRDNKGIFTDEIKAVIAKELGDVLWYIAATAEDIGYSLEEIANINVDKLTKRREQGKISGSGDDREIIPLPSSGLRPINEFKEDYMDKDGRYINRDGVIGRK